MQSASFRLAGAEFDCAKQARPQLRSGRDRAGVFNSKFSPWATPRTGPLAMAAFCACALPHPQSSALAAAFCAHARPCLPPWATAHRNLASSAMPAGSMPAAPSAAGARSRLAPVRESLVRAHRRPQVRQHPRRRPQPLATQGGRGHIPLLHPGVLCPGQVSFKSSR